MTGVLIFFAVAVATFAVLHIGYVVTRAIEYALAEEDATYPRLVPADRALWEPCAPLWESETPLYDALAAEHLRAELDDDDALRRWLEATS